MECLLSQPAIFLFTPLSIMKKKEILVNQILRTNLMHVIDKKAPDEVHLNSLSIS